MHTRSLLRPLAAPLIALALAAASQAHAGGGVPPDPDTTAIGFIQHVRIGTPACDTCPPRVCPGEPVQVTISGELPSPCFQFRGFRELPVAAPFTALQADFVVDTCGIACPLVTVPFSATVSLPGSFNTSGMFVLNHQVRSCPDTFTVASSETRQYTYAIEPNCVVPPPIDSLVRTFVTFEVLPAPACPGDSLMLVMRENGCPPCLHLTSLSHNPMEGFQAVMEWTPVCAEFRCDTDTLSTPIGVFAAGLHQLRFPVIVRVLGTPNPDSAITYVQKVAFEVGQRCPPGGDCVEALLPPRSNLEPVCAITLPPGGVGDVNMPVRTGLPIWGAQGSLVAHHPIRILDVNYAGSTPGTFVTWNRDGDLVRFVAFTTSDSPMIPVGRSDFLRLTIRVDSAGVLADPALVQLGGRLEVAAGRNGETLPFCPEFFDLAPTSLAICISTARDTCDANGDGRTDVRDLVSMVSCLRPDTSLALRNCPDCNGDSLFDLADLLCCARHILRAPHVPRDSAHASADVRVAFGTFRPEGTGWRVPVRITGAGALAGSLLRLRYPAERWRADIPVELASVTTTAGWMPIVDVEQPGVVQLAWLKLDGGETSELTFELALRPQGEPQSSDAISVEGADLVLADGTALRPVDPLPVGSLIAPLEPPTTAPARLELGPARPNPFNSSTRFSVSLPRASTVELTVHDVAGRNVATLARGQFAAGVREFAWDGASARDGVYFVRLSVDGRVLSQRVALLRTGR
jgi:hypothetical protein